LNEIKFVDSEKNGVKVRIFRILAIFGRRFLEIVEFNFRSFSSMGRAWVAVQKSGSRFRGILDG